MDKVYILTLNGEIDNLYGEYVYIGVFESELLATEAMKNIISKYPNGHLSTRDFELECISMNQVKVWHL